MEPYTEIYDIGGYYIYGEAVSCRLELVGTETGWVSPEIGTELWPKLGKGPYAQQDLEVMKGFSVLVDFQMSGAGCGWSGMPWDAWVSTFSSTKVTGLREILIYTYIYIQLTIFMIQVWSSTTEFPKLLQTHFLV